MGSVRAGFFLAEQSQPAAALAGGAAPAPQRQLKLDTLWLVFKWEGLQPLSVYPRAEQQLPVFFWAQGSDGQLRARCRMLRWGIRTYKLGLRLGIHVRHDISSNSSSEHPLRVLHAMLRACNTLDPKRCA